MALIINPQYLQIIHINEDKPLKSSILKKPYFPYLTYKCNGILDEVRNYILTFIKDNNIKYIISYDNNLNKYKLILCCEIKKMVFTIKLYEKIGDLYIKINKIEDPNIEIDNLFINFS